MQSVTWLGFCVSQSMSRSLLHFFPSCENASAPYAASCSLSLFGGNGPSSMPASGISDAGLRSKVVLDGGRLGHPDGLRLEDAFPALRGETSGMFGLEVEISTPQPRLDVRSSGCIVEVISQSQPVRFSPKKMVRKEMADRYKGTKAPMQDLSLASGHAASGASGVALRDGHSCSSLIVVNAGSQSYSIAVYSLLRKEFVESAKVPEGDELPLFAFEVPAGATREHAFADGLFEAASAHEFVSGRCSTIPFVARVMSLDANTQRASVQDEPTPGLSAKSGGEAGQVTSASEVAIFLVQREVRTKRMSSAVSL